MKKAFSILLGFILILASTGIHIDYAFCQGMIDHIEIGHHEEHEKSCCDLPCDEDSNCCGEKEIVQDANLDNFTTQPVLVLDHQLDFASLVFSNALFTDSRCVQKQLYKTDQPPPSYRQSTIFLQRFLC